MKTTIFSLIFLLQGSILFGQNVWSQKADFEGCARAFGVAFVINNRAYVGGGESIECGGLGYDKEMWEYNPVTNEWMQKSDLPIEPVDLVAFSAGDFGYIVGYYSNSGVWETQVWQYNPLSDQWLQKNNFPGDNRMYPVALNIGDKGYYGLGKFSTILKNDFWEYNPNSDIWTQKCDLPIGRIAATAFSIGLKGYVGLGNDPEKMNDFWQFDPLTNVWTQKANFAGSARQHAVGFCIEDKGYVGTGYDGNFRNDFWEYNGVTETWLQIANMPGHERQAAVAFTINNNGYVTSGYYDWEWGGSYNVDLWEYATIGSISNISFTLPGIDLSPNPVKDFLNIKMPRDMRISSIEIISIQGNTVKRQEIESNQKKIDVRDLQSGVYIIRMQTDSGTAMRKMVKQ